MSSTPLRPRRTAALALCVVACSMPAAAQSPIVVTGARVPLSGNQLAADVVVIDAERIATSSADSLEDLLRREAGVQLSRSGGPGANGGVFIRGANSGHTLVLVDGVRIGSATAGLAEFEGLSLAHVERIEVLRGPASSLYGADAVGGVVQIFTRRGEEGLQAGVSAGAGGFGARSAAASVAWGDGAFDLAASLAGERLDGVSALRPGDLFGNHNPDRDGFSRRSASARAGVMLSPFQRLSLQGYASHQDARYDGSDFLPPNFTQDASGDFHNRLELRSWSLEHQARWSPDWRSVVRVSRQSSDLLAGAAAPERFRTDRRQEEVQLSWLPAAGQQITLALDHLDERARTASYAADVKRSNRGLALAWAGSFDALSLQVDARHDDNSQFGGVASGRAGLKWRLAPAWRLRALAGTTFRAVAFNDLHYPGYGVPTLQPERGRSVEAGIEWRAVAAPGTRVELTAYRNAVRELVAYEPDRRFCPPGSAYDFGCARNVGRARLQGATLQGQAALGAFTLRTTVDLLDATDRASGARLARRAAHQERLALDWRGGAFGAGAELLHIGARPEAGKTLAAATLVDLVARWNGGNGLSASLQLRNATHRDFEPARDYRSLGRQWWFALRWEKP